MSAYLKLRVVTPRGLVMDRMVTSVTASSTLGEFCVMPEHQPVLASLKPARLLIDIDGEKSLFVVDVGFYESGAAHVNIMTRRCLAVEEVVTDGLEAELVKLREQVGALSADDSVRVAAESAILWIEAQLQVTK